MDQIPRGRSRGEGGHTNRNKTGKETKKKVIQFRQAETRLQFQ